MNVLQAATSSAEYDLPCTVAAVYIPVSLDGPEASHKSWLIGSFNLGKVALQVRIDYFGHCNAGSPAFS
jgi:hypothetical protein